MDLSLVLSSLFFLFLGIFFGYFIKKHTFLRQKEQEFRKLIDAERLAKEEAVDAIRARDEFLSIASHELKTPLTTITLRIQSTLDSILNESLASFSGEKLVSSLNIAHEQTGRLQKLIKDLLNFSLITRGKLEIEHKDGDLNEIVKNTLERFDDHLKLAGCELEFISNGPILGKWDQIRLEQAIFNLLTNAAKYGEGEPIKVELKKDGKTAKIIVSDNGIGIDPKLQKTIFERFKRGTKDSRYQGLGVGLFIVKQIIESHGGKVSVKSSLGKGSKFTVELPIQETSTTQIQQPATNFIQS